jgi:hypothetical protein
LLPAVTALVTDLKTTKPIPVPRLSLVAGTTAKRLDDLYDKLQQADRQPCNHSRLLHLAHLFGEIRQAHPIRFRTFTEITFPKERTRQYFTTGITRAYRLGRTLGLGRLLASRTLTFSQLKSLSTVEFDDQLLPALRQSIVLSDSEDVVSNEGAL